jgi:hypothetical protein
MLSPAFVFTGKRRDVSEAKGGPVSPSRANDADRFALAMIGRRPL